MALGNGSIISIKKGHKTLQCVLCGLLCLCGLNTSGFIIFDQFLLLTLGSFFEKFRIYHQQAKRFSIKLVAFGVVRAMRPKYGAAVFAVQLLEPAKPPVDIYVVYEEIGNAIK